MDFNLTYESLKTIFSYMSLNQEIKKCDVIIGCGCSNLDIPIVCSELYKKGFSNKIIFAGGYGKITKDKFQKQEAVIYKEIAIKEGVKEADIYLEKESSNTTENFLFSKKVMENNHWNVQSILVVHNKAYERRILNTAKKVFPEKEIIITSKNLSFDEFFKNLQGKNPTERKILVSVLVGNIQRMVLYPQFGIQVEEKVPKEVIESYQKLKKIGYDMDILSKEKILSLANKYGVKEEDIFYFE